MSAIDLEKLVLELPEAEYAAFRDWFTEHEMDTWERQIEADSNAGRLDDLINRGLKEYHAGRATDL